MAKRKLVEIAPAQYRSLSTLREVLKKNGLGVPSMPVLVQECISQGMTAVLDRYMPTIKPK